MIYKNIPKKYIPLVKTRFEECINNDPYWYAHCMIEKNRKLLTKSRIPCHYLVQLFRWATTKENQWNSDSWLKASNGDFSLIDKYEEL